MIEPELNFAPDGDADLRRRVPGSAPWPDLLPPPVTGGGAAHILRPLVHAVFGGQAPVRFEFWDGTGLGPSGSPGVIRVRSPDALRRILWSPNELGVGRAFVCGDLDVEGDLFGVLAELHRVVPNPSYLGVSAMVAALRSARQLGALGPPLPAPAEEARPRGRRHSRPRDARAVRHHYDVGNDFFRIVLGPSMTYSCARFTEPDMTLEQAQSAKHELVSRKLGLHERPRARLLDVGCGWGTMALHAAAHFGASVLGVTLSAPQAHFARERIAEAGLANQVEIRVQDYRDLTDERFDAISSIGMSEHVGRTATASYFATLRRLLAPGGRLLNHAISTPGGSRLGQRSFMGRYVFPDGELMDVGEVVLAMERAGFEVRDVESLREHYVRTLRAWVTNLEGRLEDAVALAGSARTRIWRLYMAASANGFSDGGLAVHQVLGVVPDPDGSSGMAPTRREWG